MDHAQILNLARYGRLSDLLCGWWKSRTGHDPVAVARAIEKEEFQRLMTGVIAFTSLCMSIAIFAVGIVIDQSRTMEFAVSSGCLALPAVIGGLILGFKAVNPPELFPPPALCFPYRLGQFLEWSGKDAGEIANLKSRKEIQAIADRILTFAAQLVRSTERNCDPAIPEPHSGLDEYADALKTFEEKYAAIGDLSLLSGDWGHYFDKAEAQMASK